MVPSEPVGKQSESIFSCPLPCTILDNDEWNFASFDQWTSSYDDSMSTNTSCEDSLFDSNPPPRLSPRGVYRPRSGQSARVRFVLTIESYLSGDFDLLPPEQETLPDCNANKPSSGSILRVDKVHSPSEEQEFWMNVEQEEHEVNQEYNGMVLIVAPRSVELQKAFADHCDEVHRDLDEEESCEYVDVEDSDYRDIPEDVAVVIASSDDEISQISRIHDAPERYVRSIRDETSTRQIYSSHVSFLKRFRGLRGEKGAYKVFVRHGKERFLI